jgi:hypothetical protein
MKLEELLRHMADNVEVGKRASEGILYRGEPTNIMNSIEWGFYEEDYSLAPKTHMVGRWEVPLPESEPLSKGQEYIYVNLSAPKYFSRSTWTGHDIDAQRLKRGILFLNEAALRANAKAMLGIDPYKEGPVS